MSIWELCVIAVGVSMDAFAISICVVRTESQKFKINMLSAVSKRGKLRFVLYKDNMNSDKLIDFMRRLVYDSKKKVFLILDNLRVHHSKKVQA